MLAYFMYSQKTVSAMKYSSDRISKEYDDCLALSLRLDNLRPRRNKIDFEHLELMLDIRLNYLSFKILEAKYESEVFTDEMRSVLAKDIKPLLVKSEKLKKQFVALNKRFLKNPSESLGKWDYMTKMQQIYETLNRNSYE